MTVSYTHLDVYKRQGYENIAEIITIPQMSLTGIPEETVVFERKKAALKQEFLARGLEAVSYTHLDVYKRQV